MTSLSSLIEQVREKNLTKTQLEEYRDELSHLYSLCQLSMADIKKKKAFFVINEAEKTNVATQNKWAVTPEGQNEIQLKHELDALKEMLSSIKHRIYSWM